MKLVSVKLKWFKVGLWLILEWRGIVNTWHDLIFIKKTFYYKPLHLPTWFNAEQKKQQQQEQLSIHPMLISPWSCVLPSNHCLTDWRMYTSCLRVETQFVYDVNQMYMYPQISGCSHLTARLHPSDQVSLSAEHVHRHM